MTPAYASFSLLGFSIACEIKTNRLTSYSCSSPEISEDHPSEIRMKFGDILPCQLVSISATHGIEQVIVLVIHPADQLCKVLWTVLSSSPSDSD
jgi:hypothetical protein